MEAVIGLLFFIVMFYIAWRLRPDKEQNSNLVQKQSYQSSSTSSNQHIVIVYQNPDNLPPLVQEQQKPPPKRPKKPVSIEPKYLKDYLDYKVVGQEEATQEIVNTLYINQKKGKKKILASFLFVGMTGVGKTETAKALSEYLKNQEYGKMLRFDMGGFSDYYSASTLVGSPKGYIGSNEGGALTRPIGEYPRRVILFDEIEKGHPSLYRTFMTLLDEGQIQDVSNGETYELDHGIIIFTSNFFQGTIKWITENIDDPIKRDIMVKDVFQGKYEGVPYSVIQRDRELIPNDTRLNFKFPPEFLGRIDKIVVFNNITFDHLVEIAERRIMHLKKREDIEWARELATKYKPVADAYGVREFIRKVEEEIILN